MKNKKDFIAKLQGEAKKQSLLHEKTILPRQLEGMAAVIAEFPWQVILSLAIISALAIEFLL